MKLELATYLAKALYEVPSPIEVIECHAEMDVGSIKKRIVAQLEVRGFFQIKWSIQGPILYTCIDQRQYVSPRTQSVLPKRWMR